MTALMERVHGEPVDGSDGRLGVVVDARARPLDCVEPCERVAYRTGELNVALNLWCGVLLMAVAAWLLWELWSAVAPKPITDDFLQLLDKSFGRDWRSPRTWPWARIVYAYGFTLVGVTVSVCIGLLISAVVSSRTPAKAASVHVETSQSFRLAR